MRTDCTVLLLSHQNEPFCTARVADALAARGVRVLRFDTDTFPASLRLCARLGMAQPSDNAALFFEDEPLSVDSVWLWRLWPAQLPTQLPPEQLRAAQRESMTTLLGFLDLLGGAFWMDPPDAMAMAENKTRQLRIAQSVGLTIPPTLVGADPQAARDFFHLYKGRVVAKLQTSLGHSMHGGGGLPTRLLRPEDLAALDGLASCPMVFQQYVEKRYELRVAWVDGQAFVGALDGAKCGVDWRYETTAAWQRFELPESIRVKVAALMQRLSLRQGALDFIVTPSGEHIFLEVNPHGEWGMLERDLGLPIGAALADALLRRGKIP